MGNLFGPTLDVLHLFAPRRFTSSFVVFGVLGRIRIVSRSNVARCSRGCETFATASKVWFWWWYRRPDRGREGGERHAVVLGGRGICGAAGNASAPVAALRLLVADLWGESEFVLGRCSFFVGIGRVFHLFLESFNFIDIQVGRYVLACVFPFPFYM